MGTGAFDGPKSGLLEIGGNCEVEYLELSSSELDWEGTGGLGRRSRGGATGNACCGLVSGLGKEECVGLRDGRAGNEGKVGGACKVLGKEGREGVKEEESETGISLRELLEKSGVLNNDNCSGKRAISAVVNSSISTSRRSEADFCKEFKLVKLGKSRPKDNT